MIYLTFSFVFLNVIFFLSCIFSLLNLSIVLLCSNCFLWCFSIDRFSSVFSTSNWWTFALVDFDCWLVAAVAFSVDSTLLSFDCTLQLKIGENCKKHWKLEQAQTSTNNFIGRKFLSVVNFYRPYIFNRHSCLLKRSRSKPIKKLLRFFKLHFFACTKKILLKLLF